MPLMENFTERDELNFVAKSNKVNSDTVDFKEHFNYEIFKYGLFLKNVLSTVILPVAFLTWVFWNI